MEMQQTTYQERPIDGSPSPDAGGGAAEALAACQRLTAAADAAIEQAYSGNAETFLAANRQSGGQ